MKRNTASLCALVSVSSILILPVLSEDSTRTSPEDPKIELDEKLQIECLAAIQEQVIRHLNKEVQFQNRFSRVVRPMPEQYYRSEIVGKNEDGNVEFNLVLINRLKPVKPPYGVIARGQFKSETGEVLLEDQKDGKYLPASKHPLINNKTKS